MSSPGEGPNQLDPLDRMIEEREQLLAKLQKQNNTQREIISRIGVDGLRKLQGDKAPQKAAPIRTIHSSNTQGIYGRQPAMNRRGFLGVFLGLASVGVGYYAYDALANKGVIPNIGSDELPFDKREKVSILELLNYENILGEAHWSCPYESFSNAGPLASLIHERGMVIPPNVSDKGNGLLQGYVGAESYTTVESWKKLGFTEYGPGLGYDACFTAVLLVAALQRAGEKLGLGSATKNITMNGMSAYENPLVRWHPHYQYPDIDKAIPYYPDVGNNAAVFIDPLQDITFLNPSDRSYGIGAYYYRDDEGDYKNKRGSYTIGVYVYQIPGDKYPLEDGERCPVVYRDDLYSLHSRNDHDYPALDISLGKPGATQSDPESSWGQLIVSPRNGVVKSVNTNPLLCGKACGGMFVEIETETGETVYLGHGQRVFVEKGKKVVAGSLLMEMGSTGESTGPHLHAEVNQGGVDPKAYGLDDARLNFSSAYVLQSGALK